MRRGEFFSEYVINFIHNSDNLCGILFRFSMTIKSLDIIIKLSLKDHQFISLNHHQSQRGNETINNIFLSSKQHFHFPREKNFLLFSTSSKNHSFQ
jgi:hypothetical protein